MGLAAHGLLPDCRRGSRHWENRMTRSSRLGLAGCGRMATDQIMGDT